MLRRQMPIFRGNQSRRPAVLPTVLAATIAASIALSACAPAGSPGSTGLASPATTPSPAPAGGSPIASPAPTGVGPPPATATPLPPATSDALWQTAELHDVRNGETLRIADLRGRPVVIEPMAIWCVNCREQQNEATEALAMLEDEDLVYISLDVDPNETESDLAAYADQQGYDWHFAVASREVARSLAETFGDQVLSPPSTPSIRVTRDGQAEVSFGLRPAEQLVSELAPLLD
jgi:thiol-disulfide isomerase/thioredoxin